jgi:hypothetical protein
LYEQYFNLSALGLGRLMNLAVGLLAAHTLLTRHWKMVQPLERLFVTLGRNSLGAFVLHVYGLLAISHLALPDRLWANGLVQVAFVLITAALLNPPKRPAPPQPATLPPREQPLAA